MIKFKKSFLKLIPSKNTFKYIPKLKNHNFQIHKNHYSNETQHIPLTQPPFSRTTSSTTNKKQKILKYWYLTLSGLVIIIIIVGGLTRLEEGGLSMVTWKPLGSLPPTSSSEWEKEFSEYKKYPEYQKKNIGMTMNEFKYIFWFEYIHRMIGRLIGAVYIIPAVYFTLKGGYFTNRYLKLSTFGIGTLIGLQGLLGWYMVKSGLDKDHELMKKYNNVPRVSQYRLASHLSLAVVIYSMCFWNYLKMDEKFIFLKNVPENFGKFKFLSMVIGALVFTTIVSGAFVAGMDAGMIYNTFPKMGDRWVPREVFNLKPWYKNFFENQSTVQFDHRVLAMVVFVAVGSLFVVSRGRYFLKYPKETKEAVAMVFGAVCLQVGLGICTVLYVSPTKLASSHQTCSMVLWTSILYLLKNIKRIR